ncbi:MAG: hypothetical protein NTV52_22820 [Acidobacteria bacterium]|nr:hypothetical protein [Acidobacteriota bacterium]
MKPRENPFRNECVEGLRYRVPGVAAEALMPMLLGRFAGLGFRGALVGPKGHGKTTLLEGFAGYLRGEGYVVRVVWARVGERLAPLGTVSPGEIVCLNGAEALSYWGWWRFRWEARGAAGILVTAHREGMLPTLWRCETTAALFEELVGELAPGVDPAGVFERNGGNVREGFRELYRRCAK